MGSGKNGGNSDPRFAFMSRDPRYRKMPKNEQKVKIDDRFKGMFTDKRFKMDYVVDKVGRKIQTDQYGDDLHRLYEIENKDGKNDEGDEGEEWQDDDEEGVEVAEEENSDDDGVDIRAGQAISQDGEGADEEDEGDIGQEGDSDSETSDSDVDSEVEADLAAWNEEEQKEAEKQIADVVEGDATSRLAVMNMDWDVVKAVDILVMLNSFLPPGSHISKVTVYPSNFGLEQMAREATSGPVSIWKPNEKNISSSSNSNSKKATKEEVVEELGDVNDDIDQEKLRQYENQRLRYYYAIVECDSVNAARALYSECDGLEMEASANVLDIRFVPEGTTFENPVRDTATRVPANYKVSKGLRKGLQHTKLECSWDTEDPLRANTMTKIKQRKWNKKDEIEEDLEAYLGSDSSDGYGTDAVTEAEDEEGGHVLKRKARSKFKDILNGFKNEKEEEEAKMYEQAEIVFRPGLSEKGAELLENMDKKKALAKEGVWETKVRLRAEALKAKKKRRKELAQKREDGGGDEDEGDDRGLTKEERNDPFFADAFDDDEDGEGEGKSKRKKVAPAADKKKRKKPRKEEKTTEETQADDRAAAELDLLLMDEQKGFSMKDMVKKPDTKSQKKKAKKQKLAPSSDTPAVDVKDSRFQAIFTNPDLAIDPTHHLFKPTAGMDQLLAEKRRRTKQDQAQQASQATLSKERAKAANSNGTDDSLASLVASVKQKAGNFKPKTAKPLIIAKK